MNVRVYSLISPAVQRLSFCDSSPEFLRRSSLNHGNSEELLQQQQEEEEDDSFLAIMDDQSEVSISPPLASRLKRFAGLRAVCGVTLPPPV